MKKKQFKMTRRQVLKAGLIGGAGLMMPLRFLPAKAFANDSRQACNILGCDNLTLSDPSAQPKFENPVPNALDPGFIYQPDNMGRYKIQIRAAMHTSGLVDSGGNELQTPIWGYADQKDKWATWPGRTFVVQSGGSETEVFWANSLKKVTQHLLPVDTNLHWCYALHGASSANGHDYTQYSIANNGVPIITHLHGGHSDFQFDGNPEFFYSPGNGVIGPQWDFIPGGFTTKFRYDNDVPAGNLWYHDHALGITRLNVYAGLAGFYFVRDDDDTGDGDNTIGVPWGPYELAYAIQDRMFLNTGELFYPAFIGDPYYDAFIESPLPSPPFDAVTGGPTALAEFFGDHMVVNGIIWPYAEVEPRNYRMHLLNGTDSRFMALQFFEVPTGAEDFLGAIQQLDFTVIGSDQGLADAPTTVDTLVSEPGSRYDIIVDFSQVTSGNRVIMKNIGGDEPFGGDLTTDDPDLQVFDCTDRIMAFDVNQTLDMSIPDVSLNDNFPAALNLTSTRIRKVALFEGMDEFGRLQPLLGTAEAAKDYTNSTSINWPATPVYQQAVLPDGTSSPLTGPIEGSVAWHSPTTENPALDTTEEWEIWNMTGDGHPVHLHLVNFQIVDRQEIVFDSEADEDGFIPDGATPAGDGVYLVKQPTVQHNSVAGDASTYGMGFKIVHPTNPDDAYGAPVPQPEGYVENAPKDMVTALPGQITRIRAVFDKPGRYVWHCHILSHEDHEMMRVLHVGEGA